MTEHTADLRREEIARIERARELLNLLGIDGPNIRHAEWRPDDHMPEPWPGPRWCVCGRRMPCEAAELGALLREHDAGLRSQDTATARIAALEGALDRLVRANRNYTPLYDDDVRASDELGDALDAADVVLRALLSGETRTGGEPDPESVYALPPKGLSPGFRCPRCGGGYFHCEDPWHATEAGTLASPTTPAATEETPE